MVSERYGIAFAETLHYLKGINESDINKIPKKFMQFLQDHSAKNYEVNFDYSKPLNDLELKDETYGIISVICLNWWCETDEEKELLKKHLIENEQKKQMELLEKYNPDDLFRKKENCIKPVEEQATQEVCLIEYKESVFKKIWNKILSIFKK